MAVPAIATVGAESNGSGTEAALGAPAGVSTGDLLIAVLSSDSSTRTFTGPEGWALLQRTNGSGAGTEEVWWKIATASNSYTFTGNAGSPWAGIAFRVTGHDSAAPIPVFEKSSSAVAVTSLKTATIVTPRNECLVLSLFAEDGDATGVSFASAGATEFYNFQEGTSFVEIAGYSEEKAVAGSIDRTATFSSNEAESIILAVQPPLATPKRLALLGVGS